MKGRCWSCQTAYRWTGRPKLRDARCPACKGRLRPTTHYLQSIPWKDAKPEEGE